MKKTILRCAAILLITAMLLPVPRALAWTDQAHMAVGAAAGFTNFHNCVGPDVSHIVAKINGLEQTDFQGHFFNAPGDYEITAADVYAQLQKIGKSSEECPEGCILGGILHSVRQCREATERGDFDEYYYAVLLHYIGDLSQPLHVSPYDDFNQSHHFACDNILTASTAQYPVLDAIQLASKLTVDEEFHVNSEEELVDAIVTLARQSQELANTIRREDRVITQEEALLQVSRAATLSRALLHYCGKNID